MLEMDLMYRSRYMRKATISDDCTLKVVSLGDVLSESAPLSLDNIGLQKRPEAIDR